MNSTKQCSNSVKGTGCHMHCKCGNISEKVEEDVVAYKIAAISMTLSDLQRHLTNARFYKRDFSYSWAAVGKISTDNARGAVYLRWLSFLLTITSRDHDYDVVLSSCGGRYHFLAGPSYCDRMKWRWSPALTRGSRRSVNYRLTGRRQWQPRAECMY